MLHTIYLLLDVLLSPVYCTSLSHLLLRYIQTPSSSFFQSPFLRFFCFSLAWLFCHVQRCVMLNLFPAVAEACGDGRKKGRRRRTNEWRSDLSFQVVAPLGSVMADGCSKSLPSVINVHCRWTHPTASCLAGVQLCVKDRGSIWACEWCSSTKVCVPVLSCVYFSVGMSHLFKHVCLSLCMHLQCLNRPPWPLLR